MSLDNRAANKFATLDNDINANASAIAANTTAIAANTAAIAEKQAALTGVSGYANNKLQSLINDNGTLKWKDDEDVYVTQYTAVSGTGTNNILAPKVDEIFTPGVYKGRLVATIGFSELDIPFTLYVRTTEDSSGMLTSVQQMVVGWLGDSFTVIKRNMLNFVWQGWDVVSE